MKARVQVSLKNGVLDPQGRAIGQALHSLGFADVGEVRQGKLIELELTGPLAKKPKVPVSSGTFPTDGPLFVGLLIGIILILGGLQFFPALALGPILEHVLMLAGQTF